MCCKVSTRTRPIKIHSIVGEVNDSYLELYVRSCMFAERVKL